MYLKEKVSWKKVIQQQNSSKMDHDASAAEFSWELLARAQHLKAALDLLGYSSRSKEDSKCMGDVLFFIWFVIV